MDAAPPRSKADRRSVILLKAYHPPPSRPVVPYAVAFNVKMALPRAPFALLFDVFGTCVDWRSTVTHALERSARNQLSDASRSVGSSVRLKASDMAIDGWGRFAQEWRDEYKRFTKAAAEDASRPWLSVDEHHLESLRRLISGWELDGLWLEEDVRALSLIWHHLDPWPDASAGIKELNKLFRTVTLSNGNLSLLNDLRVYADLPFTHICSAEMFGSYKPSPKVYLGAAESLSLRPQDCAMVAAHLADLKAAKACGMQTIYVERPQEEDWDEQQVQRARNEGLVDLWISGDGDGFVTLAEELGIEVERTRKRSASQ